MQIPCGNRHAYNLRLKEKKFLDSWQEQKTKPNRNTARPNT